MEIITDYKELPDIKFAEKRNASNLANIHGSKFKKRFGTEAKPLHYGTSIKHYIASFGTKTDLEAWRRLLKQFCGSTKLKCCAEGKMQSFKNIYTYRAKIFNFLLNRYHNNEISVLTLAGDINKLGTMCLYSDPFNREVRKISNDMLSYSSKIQRADHEERYGNNVLKEDSKYIPFADLVETRDKLEPEFLSLKFKGGFPTNTKDYNKHFAYLKLAVNTYYPPLRLEFQHMKYMVSNVPPAIDKTTEQNYLYYDEKQDLYSIVINHDKLTSKNTREVPAREIVHLNVNNEYINCKKLSEIFKYSFASYPRLYVFPNYKSTSTPNGMKSENGKNIGNTRKVIKMFPYRGYANIDEGNYTNLLKSYFKPPPTQNNLRQAFHTYYETVHKPPLTNKKLNDLAKRMRHSLSTARKAYVKLGKTPEKMIAKNDIDIPERIEEIQTNARKAREKKTHDLKAYHKVYNKQYFEQTYNQIRNNDNKYLNYIRSGKIKNPKPLVLEKHGIHKVNDVYQFTPEKLLERKNKKTT